MKLTRISVEGRDVGAILVQEGVCSTVAGGPRKEARTRRWCLG